MSHEQEPRDTPPDLFTDETNNDDSMFVSVMSPASVDISLSAAEDDDDEEESPFGPTPVRAAATATTTTNTVEVSAENENKLFQQEPTPVQLDDDDEDPFGEAATKTSAPAVVAAPPPKVVEAPPKVVEAPPTTPIKQESELFPVDVYPTAPPTPIRAAVPFESQLSNRMTTQKSVLSETVTTSQPAVRKRSQGQNIEIHVSDPVKVGDGMSSYMTYRITTKTSLPSFAKSEFTVNRRFSDFLGLHTKLVQRHLHQGIMLPAPPEKDSLSMAKVKISKEEAVSTDFIDRRRSLLQRYLTRLVRHEKLVEDPEVRQFIESPTDLPKSTSTQALSGAGVLRAFSSISNQVTKLTTKTSEQDQWFEEKHGFVLELHAQLRHLHNQMNTLYSHRKEAGVTLKQFSTSLNHLATIEEHPLLSSALLEFANLEEKIDQIHHELTLSEYAVLTELVKEYISLLDMVQMSFQERIRLHQQWLHAEDMLKKKREAKTKLEHTPKGADKLPQAEMEVVEWEGKVVRGKEEFENISTTMKQEIDVLEQTRMDDFKQAVDSYLANLLAEEEKILQIWEAYLPEANRIVV